MIVDRCKVNKVWCRTGNLLWIPVTAVLLIFFSCGESTTPRQITRGFYYWKSRLTVSEKEQAALTNLKTARLYIKLFDVAWNEDLQSIQPVAKLDFDSVTVQQLLQQRIQLIPVVFITNESLLKIDSSASIALAQKIVRLAGEMLQKQQLPPAVEFQLDCDWTVSTKKNYFLLVKEVKRLMRADHLSFSDSALLSATIRLHQVKYRSKSGIPEVDKGLLMCYNMGNLKNSATKNSILDTEELKKYLSGLNSYPLPLDIALPIFSWNVYFSNNTYKGIISNISKDELTEVSGQWKNNLFTFSKDTVLKNISFQKNDQLRLEESTQDELLQTANYIAEKLSPKNKTPAVLFYHLDELILNKHPQHELETLFHCFD
ncbi:MAG: hypothetical protein ABL872_00635 [Lacibacter sp.]